jgi:hypothetical protein
LLTRVTRIFHKRAFTKAAHDGPRGIPLRAFHRALRDALAKMTDAPPFFLFLSCYRPVICSCPVIALLFAAPAAKKARKYGVI